MRTRTPAFITASAAARAQVQAHTLDAECARLLQHMAGRHQGQEQGVSAAALAAALGISPRQLRRLISVAREQGVALCGHPEAGYYIATTADELRSAAAWLEHRALHSLRLLAQMRRISLPELLGQLRLPT